MPNQTNAGNDFFDLASGGEADDPAVTRPASLGTTQVAVVVGDGVRLGPIEALRPELLALGAMLHFVARRTGSFTTAEGFALVADGSFETSPSFLFDAAVLPDGEAFAMALASHAQALKFITEQHHHRNPMWVMGASKLLLKKAGITATLPNGDRNPAMVLGTGAGADSGHAFLGAIGRRGSREREAAPPLV